MADAYGNASRGGGGGLRASLCCGDGDGDGGGASAQAREIEQLSREGSHYSLSTGILPSLGARSNRRVRLRSFIISPYDRRYRFVRILIFLLFFWFEFVFGSFALICMYHFSVSLSKSLGFINEFRFWYFCFSNREEDGKRAKFAGFSFFFLNIYYTIIVQYSFGHFYSLHPSLDSWRW